MPVASVKEQVTHVLDGLSEAELLQVAEYVAFLRFPARALPLRVGTAELAALYAEFAEEDRALAEEGVEEYHARLQAEDT